MTREEELLERIEEQKKYIKLLEEQNEALQKKTGDAIKELDQFRQNEQKKLDDALDELDELPLVKDKPYKKPYNMFRAAEKEELEDELGAYKNKYEELSDEDLLKELDSIDSDDLPSK
jgi:vacuolar-type H+-ATPase subunit D/Vma8